MEIKTINPEKSNTTWLTKEANSAANQLKWKLCEKTDHPPKNNDIINFALQVANDRFTESDIKKYFKIILDRQPIRKNKRK